MVGKHHYQRCLDDLEGLIISRMFELTKMNMSQTGMCSYPVYLPTNTHLGYKLHKHIATALRVHSQAIHNALNCYNAATSAVSPPHPTLSWNDVVEYVFLANFDLLQDSHQDVRDRPWTNPACHVVVDHHFKLEHTCEEIQHLNVKIRCVVTYIWDEDMLLHSKETEIMQVNAGLAYQVKIYRMEQGHFNVQHMDHFKKLAALPEFTGSIIPGTSTVLRSGVDNAMVVDKQQITPELMARHKAMRMTKLIRRMTKMIRQMRTSRPWCLCSCPSP